MRKVIIEKFKFVPPNLKIRPGSAIEWINRDIVPHTATDKEGTWDTGSMKKGQTVRITYLTEGTFDYICAFHPNMRGTVTVSAE